jgi:hypothetical protein
MFCSFIDVVPGGLLTPAVLTPTLQGFGAEVTGAPRF